MFQWSFEVPNDCGLIDEGESHQNITDTLHTWLVLKMQQFLLMYQLTTSRECLLLSNVSGAMKAGVPAVWDSVTSSSSNSSLTPKSEIYHQ